MTNVTLIALSIRVTSSSSNLQPINSATLEVAETLLDYPPPNPDSVLDSQVPDSHSEYTTASYPPPNIEDPTVIVNYSRRIYLPILIKSYNRKAAVEYADNCALGRNTAGFPNFGYDIDIPGNVCNDCTNYLSQMLWAGGMPFVNSGLDPNNSWNWYGYCVMGGVITQKLGHQRIG